MSFDPRQIFAAFLTMSMFAMLGNMVKKDHFDSFEMRLPLISTVQFDMMKVEQHGVATIARVSKDNWNDSQVLKPCWSRPGSRFVTEEEDTRGYAMLSLSYGPEYHMSQIADAVVVARYLGAALVLPDIRGIKLGDTRKFEELYDVEKFVKSLDGVVKISKEQPATVEADKVAVLKIPNRVTEDYIAKHVEPAFKAKGNVRLVTFFPSVNMKVRDVDKKKENAVACLAMFDVLEFQPQILEVADLMLTKLRTLSKSNGSIIAVDLRVDILQGKGCSGSEGTRKSCYTAGEIGSFLQKTGFDRETVIYLTQSRWHPSLETLKTLFPETYTKESIVPVDLKEKFLNSGNLQVEKAIDFYICSESEVFVPAISGLFYANVAGKRIALGKTQILVPAQIDYSFAPASNFISPYVSKQQHLVYTCFC